MRIIPYWPKIPRVTHFWSYDYLFGKTSEITPISAPEPVRSYQEMAFRQIYYVRDVFRVLDDHKLIEDMF